MEQPGIDSHDFTLKLSSCSMSRGGEVNTGLKLKLNPSPDSMSPAKSKLRRVLEISSDSSVSAFWRALLRKVSFNFGASRLSFGLTAATSDAARLMGDCERAGEFGIGSS